MIFQKKIEQAYRAWAFTRYDDKGLVKYFSHVDFEGMRAEPYTVPSSHGHILQGYFYSYEGYDPARLIIFEHGMGGGHRSYMKEIECLCAAGYRVFAYDHTGCMESGGESTGGFSQSLCDLDDCLKCLKADSDINTSDLSVVGHSWGGFAALNISALHADVKRIAVFCAPVSVKNMIDQFFRGLLKGYRKQLWRMEAESNPAYVNYNAVSTLQNTSAKVLLIYSENDRMVQKPWHYDVLHAGLADRENIEFWLMEGKGHNPNYTYDAVEYLSTLASALEKDPPKTDAEKQAFRNSFDWDRMTAQDPLVWHRILDFLK